MEIEVGVERPLPYEALELIFKDLSLADIRSSRLVCRSWYFFLNETKFREKRKYILQRPKNSQGEINNFLTSTELESINVEFINVDLKKLDFANFGGKIRELSITNCNVQDPQVLTNVLLRAPNLTRFNLNLENSEFDFDPVTSYTPEKIITALRENNFVNYGLKAFEYRGDPHDESRSAHLPPTSHRPQFTIPQLFTIFPRLRSVNTWRQVHLMDAETRSALLKSGVKELYLFYPIDFDEIGRADHSLRFPKFEILRICVGINFMVESSVNSLLEFLKQQSQLKKLCLHFLCNNYCECSRRFGLNSTEILRRIRRIAKRILFHLLENCTMLEDLTINLNNVATNLSIFFNVDAALRFYRLLNSSKIRSLLIPAIYLGTDNTLDEFTYFPPDEPTKYVPFEITSFLETCAYKKLNEIGLVLGECKKLDLRHLLFGYSRLESACVVIESHNFKFGNSGNLAQLLNTQKKLKSLKVMVTDQRKRGSGRVMSRDHISNSVYDQMEHLSIIFHYSTMTPVELITYISAYKFPNLTTLTLKSANKCSRIIHYQNREEKNKLINWVKEMTSLIELNIQCCGLKIKDCIQICASMKRLRTLVWAIPQDKLPDHKKIMELFLICPTLQSITAHTYATGWRHDCLYLGIATKSTPKFIDAIRYFYHDADKSVRECRVLDFEETEPQRQILPWDPSFYHIRHDIKQAHGMVAQSVTARTYASGRQRDYSVFGFHPRHIPEFFDGI